MRPSSPLRHWIPLVFLTACASGAATVPAASPGASPSTGRATVGSPGAVASTPQAPAVPRIDDPILQKVVELAHTESKVNELLATMLNRFGPRLTGSHNLMAAEKWARDQLAAWGLDARLERWGEFPVGFDRGPAVGFMTVPERVELDFTTRAWSPGVLGPAEGPTVLYPTSRKELEALTGKLEGAWVIHRAKEKLDKKLEKEIDDALRAAGIAGHIFPARDTKGKLVRTSGNPRVDWGDLPEDVGVILRADQHADIVARTEAGEAVRVSFSIDNRFFRGPVPLYNVIADIKGTEKPDEYVIVGGHIDSWDGAMGAVDNGTGVATTLEAARLLMAAGARPKRTIRFMLWSGEEQGLLGSRAYVKAHPELHDKISVVLVHDGGTNYLSGLSVTPEMGEDMKEVFEPVFELNPERPFALFYADALSAGGSDHSSFLGAGIPGFFWHQSGKADYSRSHHTQHDTLEHVVPEYQVHSSMVVAIAAYNLANLEGLLDRTDMEPIDTRRIGVDLDGLTITEVKEGSVADKVGIKVGDVIAEVDGKPIESLRDLFMIMRSGKPAKTAKMRRGKKLVTITFDWSEQERKIAERRARRQAKFGDIDYEKPFAGRLTREDEARLRRMNMMKNAAEGGKAE